MRKGWVLVLVAVLGAFAAELLTHLGTPASAEAPKPAWKIVGQLEEACSCSAACPCWFNSKPTRMNCSGGEFVFIQKGNYGNVKLDGLAMGQMSQSPNGKGMMESFGDWNFLYTYIDEKATPEQRDALKAISDAVLIPNASKKHETRFVPLTRTIEGTEHKISLGKYGQFSGHLVEGGLGGSVKITNPPGADPLHQEYNQGQTTTMTFNDAGQDWNLQGSNYMYGTFEIDDKQYEKFAAGLAQKMKDMKH